MNGITYFKLVSPYEGDVTKNSALTGPEVDDNFFVLEGRDIKSVDIVEDKIVINLVNGEKITSEKNLTADCVKEITFDFDEVNGILKITKDGQTQEITGFTTDRNIATTVISVDGSLKGKGTPKTPMGISPVHKTGMYKPVKQIINTLNEEESLPSKKVANPGDRFLTIENINEYGLLYNYDGIQKILCKLQECGSEWRIPTKEEWDDMLDAVEPFETDRIHSETKSNMYLGNLAGKLLKSKYGWVNSEDDEEDKTGNCFCNHNNDNNCNATYCGETGRCRNKYNCMNDTKGVDKYGFNVLPAGYANEAKNYMYFGERAYFWTATNYEGRDAYIKAFTYNSSKVLQDILGTDNFLSLRLVKDFDGDNYNETEEILGDMYPTVIMPSLKSGQKIWTAINIGITGCGCTIVKPNGGEGMGNTIKYFVNEWTGREWLRKELQDGETVVVINDKDKEYVEYRNIKGELVDVHNTIYEQVVNAFGDDINKINDNISEISSRVTKNEESIVTVNDNLVNAVNTINENVANSINTINENVANGFNTINEAIEVERQKIENIDTLDSEGTVFNKETGVLTLKSKKGTNDIDIQFTFNFGTF